MTSIVGVKIQARNFNFINPTTPTREDVRKANYRRRQKQLKSEGFKSQPGLPYVMLGGDPVNVKLRRDKVSIEDDVIVNLESVDDYMIRTNNLSRSDNIRSSRMRDLQSTPLRSRCSENMVEMNRTIRNEVKKTDLINQNVKSGQSFFKIIKKEQEAKQNMIDQMRFRELTDVKAPREDSDSEGSDAQYPPSTVTLDFPSRPTTAGVTAVSQKSRKARSRPFTPVFNNISRLVSKENTSLGDGTISMPYSRPITAATTINIATVSSRDSEAGNSKQFNDECLYRQLCALQWILNCMVLENSDSVPRITLSWGSRNEENNLTSNKSRRDIKQAWDKFVSRPVSSARTKETTRSFRSNLTSGNTGSKKDYDQSDSTNNYAKQSPKKDADHDAPYDMNKTKMTNKPASATSRISYNERIRPHSSIAKRREILDKVKAIEEELQKQDKSDEYKTSLRSLRMSRPQTAAGSLTGEVILNQKDRCSESSCNFVEQSRMKSQQMTEERMIELKENIKNMSDYKMLICQNKFKDFRPSGSFQKSMKRFRNHNTYSQFFSDLDAPKTKALYADWYLKLQSMVLQITSNHRINSIVLEMQHCALKTVTKLTQTRLYTVLKSLSHWEICHPDISAAINFITDHIAPISDTEYYNWLTTNFGNDGDEKDIYCDNETNENKFVK